MTAALDAKLAAEPASSPSQGLDAISRDWRDYISASEQAELARCARRQQRLDDARALNARRVKLIRDRCHQRRRYALLSAAARTLGVLP